MHYMKSGLKPFLIGLGGALTAFLLAGLALCGYLVWMGSRHGEAAYQYINQAIQAQQKAQSQRPAQPGQK